MSIHSPLIVHSCPLYILSSAIVPSLFIYFLSIVYTLYPPLYIHCSPIIPTLFTHLSSVTHSIAHPLSLHCSPIHQALLSLFIHYPSIAHPLSLLCSYIISPLITHSSYMALHYSPIVPPLVLIIHFPLLFLHSITYCSSFVHPVSLHSSPTRYPLSTIPLLPILQTLTLHCLSIIPLIFTQSS